jgi:hypothetical protein
MEDMSDPRMAAAMEEDMRRRFWLSLVLRLPVVAYSPLATNVLGLRLPAFGPRRGGTRGRGSAVPGVRHRPPP